VAAFTASPAPGAVSPAELIEQLGAEIGQLYAEAELAVLKLTADAVRKGLDTTDLAERAAILRRLQAAAAGVAQGLVPSRLARQVLAEAAQAGDQAAIERLGLAPKIRVSSTRLSVTAANAIAELGVQLVGGLSALTPAILRSSADVYQRTIATVTAQSVAGGMTRYEAQRQATTFLAREGSPTIAYGNGARMPVGSYAEMATRTASNRAWQEGHIGRMTSSGVNLVQIVIGVGSCEKCARWAGKVLSTDGRTGQVEAQHATDDGTVTVTVAATLDQARAAGWNHPNCFPGWVPVQSTTGLAGADTRWYSGDVVRVRTTSGREVTVTPNHPVLTTEGWVAAGAIHEGDHLIRHNAGIEGVSLGAPDHEGAGKTRISEVYETLRQSSHVSAATVPGAAEQFHGDGAFDSDVHVVGADRLLGADGKPAAVEYTAEGEFLFGGRVQPDLTRPSAGSKLIGRAYHAADSIVGSDSEALPLLDAGAGHTCVHCGGPITEGDALPVEQPSDHVAGDALGAGELLDGLAGQVSADQVVEVSRYEWSGHVFNLETGGGWYLADDLIVHNCRCTVAGYFPGIPSTGRRTTYDPKTEKARSDLRALERQKREYLRREAIAATPLEQAAARREVRNTDAKIRDHVKSTGVIRQRQRESLIFTGEKAPRTPVLPVRVGP